MKGLERTAFWFPLACGGALAALLASFSVVPQWQQWRAGERRLVAMRQQVDQLPLLRRQLATELVRLDRAQQQQDLVFNLIGGSGNLATFLAEADQVASRTGVQLDLYEPQVQVWPAETPDQPAAPADAKAAKPVKDPLEVGGLQKQGVLLAAKGRFTQVLAFLRAMERLNVLVVQSDLQLALEDPKAATAARLPADKVVLKLNVALYGRKP